MEASTENWEAKTYTAGENVGTGKLGNITLVAQWSANEYTITYDSYGGSEVPNETYTVLDTITLDSTVTKTGYTLSKWVVTTANGNWELNAKYDKGAILTSMHGNVTLTAEWAAETYTITYDVNGGENITEQTYTIETNVTLAGAPTREGYSFKGWLLEASTENWEAKTYTANENVGTGKLGNITLVAQWSKNEYTLSQNWFDKISETITERGFIKTIQFTTSTDIPTAYSGKIAVGETDLDLIYLSYIETDGMYDVVIWSSQTIFAPVNSKYLFSDKNEKSFFNNLTNITFDNFNTSKVTNMSSMFYECSSLQTLDISSFDISKVETFNYFCNLCINLESISMPETHNNVVRSISIMFAACYKLKSLDLSMFDLRNLPSSPIAVLSFNTSMETIIAPYTTGSIELNINLPDKYYVVGDASVLYDKMTSTNVTFSKMNGNTLSKTVLKQAGKTLSIDINVENMNEDLVITLTNENVNNVSKIIDAYTDAVVLKSGRWTISSDFDLDLTMLKEMFDQSNSNFKVEVIQESTEFILVISELK